MSLCIAIQQKLQRIDGEVAFLKVYCASFESFTTGASYISELFRYLVSKLSFTWELVRHSFRARTFSFADTFVFFFCRTDTGSDIRIAKLARHQFQESFPSPRYALNAL